MDEKGYKKLRAYQEANQLVKLIYSATTDYPKSEMFGLVSQMRRSAVSVVANLIEGNARQSSKEFRQFLSMSVGSLVELEYYIDLSLDLRYVSPKIHEALDLQRTTTGALLGGFLKSINKKLNS